MVRNLRSAALCLFLSFPAAARLRRRATEDDILQTAHIIPIDRTTEQELLQLEEGSLTQLQLRPEYIETLTPMELVKENEIQMSRMTCLADSCKEDLNQCESCSATYCLTNSIRVTENPEKYPSYMYVTDTTHCNVQPHNFANLNTLYDEIKTHDEAVDSPTTSLPVAMVIFDMGYTDSNRLTKGLSADPSSLVLVNPQPLYEAMMQCYDKRKEQLATGACDEDLVVDLVKKTADLLCRARKEDGYEKCVIKLWADVSVAVGVAERAFEDASFEYIYTDGEQYMGGVIFDPLMPERAACAKLKRNPSKLVKAACEEHGMKCEDMSVEEICALDANISMSAIVNQKKASDRLHFTSAGDLTTRVDEIVDRLHKTQGVGVPAHIRDKFLDVMDKDINGVKDPDRHTKNNEERAKNVSDTARDAIQRFMSASENAIKEFDAANGIK